jgi:hypothetical protein
VFFITEKKNYMRFSLEERNSLSRVYQIFQKKLKEKRSALHSIEKKEDE